MLRAAQRPRLRQRGGCARVPLRRVVACTHVAAMKRTMPHGGRCHWRHRHTLQCSSSRSYALPARLGAGRTVLYKAAERGHGVVPRLFGGHEWRRVGHGRRSKGERVREAGCGLRAKGNGVRDGVVATRHPLGPRRQLLRAAGVHLVARGVAPLHITIAGSRASRCEQGTHWQGRARLPHTRTHWQPARTSEKLCSSVVQPLSSVGVARSTIWPVQAASRSGGIQFSSVLNSDSVMACAVTVVCSSTASECHTVTRALNAGLSRLRDAW